MKQKIGGSYIKCRLKWIAAVIGCGIVMTAVLFLNEVPVTLQTSILHLTIAQAFLKLIDKL